MNITSFESLLAAASQQPDPQRILFVFLKASLPKDHDSAQAQRFASGQGGALQAVMCVDKSVGELSNFADLVQESELMEQDWQIVLVGCLAGHAGLMPTAKDAEQPLKVMVETVQSGGDVTRYLAFDRQGEVVRFC